VGIQGLKDAIAITTIGDDIYFREEGFYNPDTASGIGLIGHGVEHNKQYHHLGGFQFFVKYNAEYVDNRRRGADDYTAYKGISFEFEAYKKQALIQKDSTL
jgi:hypothetical protein